MFKLRHLLFGLFALLSMVPLIVFGVWTHIQITHSTFAEVQDRHMLLARNLGATLSRYHSDVQASYGLIAANLARSGDAGPAAELMRNLGFRHICLADMTTGAVTAGAAAPGQQCPATIAHGELARLKAMTGSGVPYFTPVTAGDDGGPVIHILSEVKGQAAVGSLDTDYLKRLGRTITFGTNGHAAIVDQEGNILAHPSDDWVAERRNVAGSVPLARMRNGESGIVQFFSAALNTDFIAGFAPVPGPGWGVMVPQPVSELYASAAISQRSVVMLGTLALVVVAILSIAIAYQMARPMERIIQAARQTKETTTPTDVVAAKGWLIPRELGEVQDSFNAMALKLRENLAEMRYFAFTDAVTGLPNREAFRILVSTEMDRMRKKGSRGSLLYIDLDDFKAVNDTLGHDIGDELLQAISSLLADAVHAATGRYARSWPHSGEVSQTVADGSPVIGRDGGDEFTIFVPGVGDADQLLDVLTAVKARLTLPIALSNEEVVVGASIGAARFPRDGDSFPVLRKRADIAMYHAKRGGKNNFQIYGIEIGDVTVAELRRAVSHGIKNGEFVLFYQPKVNARAPKVEGVEALVRWDHPQRGMLPPNAFIPQTENSDVIIELGEWVLREACGHINELRRNGLDTRVAVNISARQFCAPEFVDCVRATIMESGIDPSSLELEITEEAVLPNLRATQKAIQALREMNVRIALDDFGRGYSNLTRVADLAVDMIKVDAPLTARVTSEERVKIIVKSTMAMARGLGCVTVAEGVETMEQATCLAQIGCDQLQGFHFARPMAFRALIGWIKAYERSGYGADEDFLDTRIKQIA